MIQCHYFVGVIYCILSTTYGAGNRHKSHISLGKWLGMLHKVLSNIKLTNSDTLLINKW